MKRILCVFLLPVIWIASCKKQTSPLFPKSTQLYPLTSYTWVYVDSFYDVYGNYYGYDTFYLKPGKEISLNNHVYVPITDQFNDSVFILRSDDTSVFIMEPLGEARLYSFPIDTSQPYITYYDRGDTVTSILYTKQDINTYSPSYRVLITQDDGTINNYKQQKLYFVQGLGIIKGQNIWKNYLGDLYTSDVYTLLYYNYD